MKTNNFNTKTFRQLLHESFKSEDTEEWLDIYFTRPIGLFLGGFMVDSLCEPFMEAHSNSAMLTSLFGSGKGSGAAMMMLILGLAGSAWCLLNSSFMKKYHFSEE